MRIRYTNDMRTFRRFGLFALAFTELLIIMYFLGHYARRVEIKHYTRGSTASSLQITRTGMWNIPSRHMTSDDVDMTSLYGHVPTGLAFCQ